MKPNLIYDFIQTHWKVLYRFALASARLRFRQFGRSRTQLIHSQDPKDVVSSVIAKVCTPPYEINPEDLTLERFKRKLGNLINTEVSKLIRNRKGRRTEARDPTENMSDEQFFDWLLSEAESAEEQLEIQQKAEERIGQIKRLLLDYEEKDPEAYFVLEDWLKGNSLESTASNNGMPLNEVKNARKRIKRALR